jgi:hypothetical protein
MVIWRIITPPFCSFSPVLSSQFRLSWVVLTGTGSGFGLRRVLVCRHSRFDVGASQSWTRLYRLTHAPIPTFEPGAAPFHCNRFQTYNNCNVDDSLVTGRLPVLVA